MLDLILSRAREALDDAKSRPHMRQRMEQRGYDLYVAVRAVATIKYGLILPPFDEWRNEKEAAA